MDERQVRGEDWEGEGEDVEAGEALDETTDLRGMRLSERGLRCEDDTGVKPLTGLRPLLGPPPSRPSHSSPSDGSTLTGTERTLEMGTRGRCEEEGVGGVGAYPGSSSSHDEEDDMRERSSRGEVEPTVTQHSGRALTAHQSS